MRERKEKEGQRERRKKRERRGVLSVAANRRFEKIASKKSYIARAMEKDEGTERGG